MEAGDTAFVLVSAALVLLMTPGLGLFYGGMVHRKNVLSVLVQCFVVLGLVSLQWALVGYSLAFGPDRGGLIGSLAWLGLRGVGTAPNPDYAATIPHLLFMAFQLMFALITPALIVGAWAERMRFQAFVAFVLLWTTFVYDPLAHWVWGVGGWLRNLGTLDFAGGTVVHISSGVSALVAALVVGARRGWGERPFRPHNLPLTVLGAGLLWFGWFGFNAGSALAANELAVQAFVNTHVAAAAGALAWAVAEWVAGGRPTVLGAVSGLVAGLVAVTPACGFVTPLAAVATGLGGGVLCYFAVAYLKPRLGYDDALDAFGVHGVGGTWGALATGLFASKAVNPAGADGLLLGNAGLLLAQLTAVAVTWAFAGLLTYVLLRLVGLFTPLRVTPDEEETGLDIALHGEEAYADLEPVALAQLFQPAPPALAAGAGAAGRADAGGVVRP